MLFIGRSPKDLARIHPALRVSGWRPPTLSGVVVRWKDIGLATFRVDRLAIRETELRLIYLLTSATHQPGANQERVGREEYPESNGKTRWSHQVHANAHGLRANKHADRITEDEGGVG